MDAGDLFVERIVEPYLGWPLLGVGGYRPATDAGTRIEVRYDGECAAVLTLEPADGRLRFATQLPIEANLQRVSVVLRQGTGERILFDDYLNTITPRHDPNGDGHGFAQRTLQAITNGEVLSPRRWLARIDRVSERLLKLRQRLRVKLLRRMHRPCSPHDAYIERTELHEWQLTAQRAAATRLHRQPVISILMPVYEAEPKWFRTAVASVLAQTYDRWELCIADDASTRVDLLAEFDRLPDDPRIKLMRRRSNGHICTASNSAADLATGEYIALLDHDDALAPNALYEIAHAINREPAADLIYSDEDKIDAANHRYDPQHKPEWSPELLLSYNYVNHFTVLRRSLFERVGRFRTGYEGSQDHDLLLRVTEQTDRVVHIPKILYHWRSLPSSTAASAGVKGYVHTNGRRAVQDALFRRGIAATLTVPAFAQKLNLPVLALDGPDDGPSVAVIVYGDADKAATAIQKLKTGTAYRNVRFYLELASDAESLNRLASSREEDYLLFVAAGLVPADRRWLSRILAYAAIPGVGAVGGRIDNAGGTIIADRGPIDAFTEVPAEDVSYYFYREVARDVAAPSRGLLLTRRAVFDRLGGFDSTRFPISLFEIDYSARLRGIGLRCVYVGDAAFAGGRTENINPHEWLAFRRAHGTQDPFANLHITGEEGLVPAVPTSPLKTLVATHNLNNAEGAPRYLSEIVFGLRDRGVISPVILSPLDGSGAKEYRAANVPVNVLASAWSPRFADGRWTPREYEAAQNAMLEQLDADNPDVVVANTLLMFPILEAAARRGIPSVWIIHESYDASALARLFTPFGKDRCEAAFALATWVVPASEETADLFRRCDVRHAIRVIRNGVDPAPIDEYGCLISREKARRDLRLDDTKTHIIAVGTVCERKGQHTLVEAAAILARRRTDFVCHIIGVRDAVPYAGYVRQLVKRRDAEDVVNLVRETPDPFAWFRAADVFACTSHMETFSRSILEAEIFSLPIVSTPCHGIGEQVVWNRNALRVPFHDAAAMAEHLETLIANAAKRQAMGRASRAAFEAHATVGDMLDRYQAVIQQAAGRNDGESFARTLPHHRKAA